MTDADVEHLSDLYDDEISFTDQFLGDLFEQLDQRELLESTVIMVTADHGEAFKEHGTLGHRGPPYDEQIRIPFFVAGPGIPEGLVVPALVESIDVAPTILALGGIERGAAMQGENLLPYLAGDRSGQDNLAFSELRPLHWAAVRTAEWKLIRKTDSGRQQLFHLPCDPGEQRDVAAAFPSEVHRLGSILTAHLEQTSTAHRFPPPDTDISAETRDELEALGYIDD